MQAQSKGQKFSKEKSGTNKTKTGEPAGLWHFDGTTAERWDPAIYQGSPDYGESPRDITAIDDQLFFVGRDGLYGDPWPIWEIGY